MATDNETLRKLSESVTSEDEKQPEGTVLSGVGSKKHNNEGDGPRCPQCGGTKTAHFFSRNSYGGGTRTQKDRYICASCGHKFWIELKEGKKASKPQKFLG